MVVTVAVQVTLADVDELSPVAGDHTYVLAPLAANVVEEPAHIVVTPPVAVTVGTGFTDIVVVAVLLQPAALVPVTVYVRAVVVLHTTDAPVVALRLVAGVQE